MPVVSASNDSMSRSSSTATTRPACFASSRVKTPVPAPNSNTWSLPLISAAATIFCNIARSTRKFCAKDLLGRMACAYRKLRSSRTLVKSISTAPVTSDEALAPGLFSVTISYLSSYQFFMGYPTPSASSSLLAVHPEKRRTPASPSTPADGAEEYKRNYQQTYHDKGQRNRKTNCQCDP